MPELRIAGVPVRIHPSFFVLAFLLSAPIEQLSLGSSLGLIAVWTVVLLVCVLVHELGHAALFRLFGGSPRIDVHGMGGTTRMITGPSLSPVRLIAVTLAGPAAGLALGLAVMGAVHPAAASPDDLAAFALHSLLITTIWLSVFNLLPIPPMDGGQALSSLLRATARRHGDAIAQVVAAAAAAAVVVLAVAEGWSLVALIVAVIWLQGALAYRGRRGMTDDEPLRDVLAAGWTALRSDRPDEAIGRARELLASARSGALRAEGAQLLAWSGVAAHRAGVAEEGLRSFPRNRHPDPHLEGTVALVAGDAERALPLLTDAFASRQDDGTGSAYAVALLRTGHAGDALTLVTGPHAARLGPATHRAVVDGLMRCGRVDEAIDVGTRAHTRWPDPAIAFALACAWGRRGVPEEAERWVLRAADDGFSDRVRLLGEPDLAVVRGRPAVDAALERLGTPVDQRR